MRYITQSNPICTKQVNKATVNMLRRVEPYITWGYPNLKTVRELVYKRGYGKVNKNRIPLTDNSIVEQVGPVARHNMSRFFCLPHIRPSLWRESSAASEKGAQTP